MRQSKIVFLTMAFLVIVGVASVVAQEAAEPAAQPAPAEQPAAAPAEQPAPAAPEAAPAPAPEVKRDYQFQYNGVPYAEVVRRFAQAAKKPILGDVPVEGHLTFFDSESYTYEEAFEMLNTLLAMRGASIIEQGRFIRCMPTPMLNAKIYTGTEKTENIKPTEIVTVLLPLKYLDAEVAAKTAIRMVSSYGSVAPMSRGRGVVITDHMGNIQRVKVLFDEMDRDSFSSQQVRSFALKQAQARNIVNVVNQLFMWKGDPTKMPDDWAFAASDDRSNTLVLIGVGPKLALAEDMVTQLDSGGPREGDMKVYDLKNAKAESLANSVRQALTTNRDAAGISVVGDPGSNRLIVAVPPNMIKQVDAMVEQLDVSATSVASGFRVFRLTKADANQMANVMQQLMHRARDPRTGVQPAAVMADGPTNSVIISGLAADIELATAVIQELDMGEDGLSRDVQVVPLKNGRGHETANMIRQLFTQQRQGQPGASSLRVESDPTGGSLIISASPGDWQLIQEILRKIEVNGPAASIVTRMVAVKNIRPGELAGSLHHVFNSRPRPVPVVFAPSDRTSTMLVSAPLEEQDAIADIIRSLDVGPDAPREDVTIVNLTSSDARQLAETIRQMIPHDMHGRIQVVGDWMSNSVVLRAPDSDRESMVKIIRDLDVPIQKEVSQVQTVQVQHVHASQLAGSLMQIYGRQQNQQRGQRQGGGSLVMVAAADLVIVPTGEKALIVKASPSEMEQVLAMIKQLDVPGGASTSGMRVIQLKSGEAYRVADVIRGMIPHELHGQMQVVADPGSNSVVIRGPESVRQAMEDVVATLDATARQGMRQTRLIKVEHVAASQAAETLRQLYVNRSGDHSQQVMVAAAPGDKQLIIDAPDSLVEAVAQMATSLDVAESVTAQSVRVYTLSSGSAPEIAQSLGRLYQQRDGGDRRGQPPPPRFEASATSNQVIVSASEEQFKVVDELLKQMQDVPAALASDTKTFKLQYAKARDLAPVLQNMLQGNTNVGGGQWQQQPQWQPPQEGGGENQWQPRPRYQPRSDSSAPFRVAALESNNTLIVQGTADKLALAEQLIQTFDVDVNDTEKATIQIIGLKNAKADSLAESINRTLADQAQQRGAGTRVTVTPEMNTNSLLVRGLPADIDNVLAMVQQLDVDGEARVEMKVYRLENSDVADIEKVMSKLLGDITRMGASNRRQGGGGESGYSVTADERTNSLIVFTTAANFKVIETLLADLDKGPEDITPRKQREIHFAWLENQKARDVVAKLEAMYRDRKPADRPYIEPDSFFNTITLIAEEADIKQMMEMIDKFDSQPVKRNLQVKVFPLLAMRADRMADAIERVYSQMTDAKITVTDRIPGRSMPRYPQDKPGDNRVPNGGANGHPVEQPNPSQPEPQSEPHHADPGGDVGVEILPSLLEMMSEPALADADDTGPAITISVDSESNSLVIAATREELQEIERFIQDLTTSTSTSEMDIRYYKVKSADVTAIAHTLDLLFNPQSAGRNPQAGGQAARTGRRGGNPGNPQPDPNQPPQDPNNPQPQPAPQPVPAPNVILVPYARTSMLIVRAKPAEFDMIEVLLDTLDRPSGVLTDMRIFTLKNVTANEVAANVRDLFQRASASVGDGGEAAPPANGNEQREEMIRQQLELQASGGGGGGNISVTANQQSNSVIVVASPENLRIVERLINELDQSAGGRTVVVRLYPVRAGNAEAVANSLRQAFGTGGNFANPGGRRGGVGAVAMADSAFSISANEESRVVIVSADPDKHELVQKVLDELNAAAEAAGASVVHVYRLDNAVAQGAAGALREAVSNNRSIRISADNSNNSIIINAPEAEHERLAALIADIDKPMTSVPDVRTIVLRNADPTATANNLTRIFSQQQQQAGPRRGNVIGQGLAIEVDIESKTLMVRSDEETFEKVRQLASHLDATSPRGRSKQHVFTLQYADAISIAPSMTQAFAPQPGVRLSPDDFVQIVAEANSNSLIVTANETNIEKVITLIAKIDTETTGGNRNELLVLANAKSADMVNTLRTVAANVPRGKTPVVVSADEGSNALIFAGPGGELDKLIKMAMQLDQASSAGAGTMGVYVMALENGQAVDMATKVRDLYNQQANAARAQRKSIDPLAVTADDRANALILATTKDMYEQVNGWVSQLEKITPAKGTLRVITVPNADPLEVERAIQQLYGGQGPGRPSRIGDPDEEEEEPTTQPTSQPAQEDDPQAQPQIQPQVVAPPLAAEPAALPAGRGGTVSTTVFPQQRTIFVTAADEDFEAIQALVKAMDDAAAKSRQGVQLFVLKHADTQQMAQSLNNVFNRLARRQEDLVIATPIQGTRAIVVAATEAKMKEASALIEQMDSEALSPKVEFRVYPLKNANPARLLPTVQGMLSQLQRARTGEQITVSADERTRSLIVTASASVFNQIDNIIETLDQTPQYEKVEVLILPLKTAEASRLAVVLTQMLTPGSDGQASQQARALQEQIRLLRIRSTVQDQVPELDLSQPIKITADGAAGSNSLVITSTANNLKAMAAVVEMMDRLPVSEGVMVRVAHLEHADAATVMAVLRSIFDQGQRLTSRVPGGRAEPTTASGKALTSPLNIAVDARTNTLILAGVEESVALAEIVLRDLDRENAKFTTEVRLFQVKNVSAVSLSNMVRSVFAEGAAVGGSEGLNTQVTRLKLVLEQAVEKPEDGKDEPGDEQNEAAPTPPATERSTAIAKSRPALTVQADPTSNIIIVAARSDIMPLIADVISTMDLAGAATGPNDVRILPLTHADASRLQQMIMTIYTSGPAAVQIRAEDRPTIVIDTRTNALVVSATEKTVAAVEALVARLDTKSDVEQLDVRLLKIEHVDAAEVGGTVQRIMDARVQRLVSQGVRDADAARVTIVAYARSNSLIIGGSAEGYELIKTIVSQLDTEEPALAGQIQLIPLTNANAATIAGSLSNLFNQRYQAVRSAELARQRPIIMSDVRSNSLMVVANADDSKLLTGLLEKLDIKLTDAAVGIHVVPMQNMDAAVAAPMIQNVFNARLTAATPPGQPIQPQDRVTVQIEPLSNSLLVVCSKENLELLGDLLDKVDVEPAVADGVVEIIELKNATADNVRALLQTLISQGLYKPGTSGTVSAAQAAREKVTIVAESRLNLLLVSASKENLAIVKQLVTTLDDNKLQQGDIRIFTIKNANVTQLTPTLVQFFNQKLQAERTVNPSVATSTMPLVAVPDVRTNTLLVAGGKENFDFVEKMLEQLDGPGAAANEFRRFQLENATAATLQPTLQSLFTQRLATGKSKEAVFIFLDAVSNAMLIGASPEDMAFAADIIALMDVKSEAPDATKIFPLTYANSASLVPVLQSLLRAGTTVAAVAVTSDERTNSILVTAGTADLERVADLIGKLDIAETLTNVAEMRIFQLMYADVTELATTLREALNNRPAATPGSSANRAILLQLVTRSAEGQDLIISALQQGVQLTPDRRTNMLIVTAPKENMPVLETIIKALDTVSPTQVEIKMFTLKNAAARQMAQMLTELFRLDNTNNRNVQLMMPGLVAMPGGVAAPVAVPGVEGDAAAGTAGEPVLAVTVDPRTNSLLVAGTKAYLEMATQVIEELDNQTETERKMELFRMRNSQAADIETALRSFLDRERQTLTSTLGTDAVGAADRLLEREVIVVAERATNTLLVSASPPYFDRIAEIIRELDKAPPQVLIQVLLAEVTLDNSMDLGMEWTHTTTANGHAVRTGTDFGLSAQANGFSLSVTGDNLNLFLRALQSQGRVEVLSRPQIHATDNMNAEINVGQEVPFIRDTRVDVNGGIYNTIQYETVGVILNLTPRINHEGQVKLDVAPEVSSLSTSSVQVGNGVYMPIINTRKAKTTVTVQDGHSVILGGLITAHDEKRDEKVPVLGDIPLLGWFFKHQKTVKQRTELLIILTPHVIRNNDDTDKMTDEQIEKMNLLRQMRAGMSRIGDPSLVPATMPASGQAPMLQETPRTGGNTQEELDQLNTAPVRIDAHAR
ncbi:MAG: hypothetical protein FWE88_04035 [Phycisphaerae bacterium]|nr:hypothetical protein [Phycisphaerae bacterium]